MTRLHGGQQVEEIKIQMAREILAQAPAGGCSHDEIWAYAGRLEWAVEELAKIAEKAAA